MEKNLEQSINDIKKLNETVKTEADKEDSDGNKISDDPSYKLYEVISNVVVDILSTKTVRDKYKELIPVMGEPTSTALVELMAVCMTHSAYQAIVFYDELLKGELEKQFNEYGNCLNNTIATVNAHDAVIKILRKRLEEFTNTKINEELK